MIICEHYKECPVDYCEHKEPHDWENMVQKTGEDDCRVVPCQNIKDRIGTEKDVFCKEEFIIKVKETIERGDTNGR
jgi:hypothetical protein